MIKVEGLIKEFRSGRGRVAALNGVSFVVDTGANVVVVGKSGSGKTTLLNCIGGLERPDEGRVTCFGAEVHSLSGKALSLFQRKNVGFVFQRGNLLSYLNVIENIAFPLELNSMGRREQRKRVEELLRRIDLSGAGLAMPHELSGGEIQRVAVARALAHSPKMLLADEPTASLDSATAKQLVRLMADMCGDEGCTTIISTHDSELMKLASASIQLRDGRIVGEESSSVEPPEAGEIEAEKREEDD